LVQNVTIEILIKKDKAGKFLQGMKMENYVQILRIVEKKRKDTGTAGKDPSAGLEYLPEAHCISDGMA